MFPSSNSANPFPFTDSPMFGSRPFLGDICPNSKEDDPLSSFFHFPPPFVDLNDDLLFTHFLPQPQLTLTPNATTVAQAAIKMADPNKFTTANNDVDGSSKGDCDGPWDFLPISKCYSMTEQIPRKRSGKKDRHSKIHTLQGPRDRRMRLSLEIARKFFDLQDMLGFDKASKTVEWLLTKSKAAIKELARGFPHMKHSCSGGAKSTVSSASECEVESGIDETTSNGIVSKGKSSVGIPKDKKNRQSRKAAFHPLVKEIREMARARARKRTREKMTRLIDESSPKSLNQLRSSGPFETGEESGSHNHDIKSSLEMVAEVEEPSSHSLDHQGPTQDTIEEALVITSKLSPSLIFNYQHDIDISQGACSNNNFLDFPENWGIDSARMQSSYCAMTNMHLSTGNIQERIPSSNFLTAPDTRLQSQFAEFQFYG